ncbi:MAG: nucleotidyltransferase family protein [Armatimonadota bacterium]|nr:nucleotidyltransferase family protein [Armatimonadota bacterium]
MNVERIRQVLLKHKRELQERFHVKNLAIFGSYVRGEQVLGSDLDIMVEFDQPCGWEVVDLRDYLEEILGVKVDLVTKGALMRKPSLWKEIEEELVYV